MVDSLSFVRGAWVVMAVLLVLLMTEVNGWRRDRDYNQAIAVADYELAAARGDSRHALAVRTYAMDDAEFDEKVLRLAQLSSVGLADDPIARDAQYNLANLYLRRAFELDAESDRDLLVPLVEQAKQIYRALLIEDPDHFDARYNLELALLLLPEVADVPADEERNPERSERAISTMRVEEQLP